MSKTYLQTTYKDREQVKSLGARWDPDRKQWFVPEGHDLASFGYWLPADHQTALSTQQNDASNDLHPLPSVRCLIQSMLIWLMMSSVPSP